MFLLGMHGHSGIAGRVTDNFPMARATAKLPKSTRNRFRYGSGRSGIAGTLTLGGRGSGGGEAEQDACTAREVRAGRDLARFLTARETPADFFPHWGGSELNLGTWRGFDGLHRSLAGAEGRVNLLALGFGEWRGENEDGQHTTLILRKIGRFERFCKPPIVAEGTEMRSRKQRETPSEASCSGGEVRKGSEMEKRRNSSYSLRGRYRVGSRRRFKPSDASSDTARWVHRGSGHGQRLAGFLKAAIAYFGTVDVLCWPSSFLPPTCHSRISEQFYGHETVRTHLIPLTCGERCRHACQEDGVWQCRKIVSS
jgi:hypothetical protein